MALCVVAVLGVSSGCDRRAGSVGPAIRSINPPARQAPSASATTPSAPAVEPSADVRDAVIRRIGTTRHRHWGSVADACFLPDRRIATAGSDGVRIWQVDTGIQLAAAPDVRVNGHEPADLYYASSIDTLVWTNRAWCDVQLWRLSTNERVTIHNAAAPSDPFHHTPPNVWVADDDANIAVVTSQERVVRYNTATEIRWRGAVYDAATARKVADIKPAAVDHIYYNRLPTLFTRDGRWIALAGIGRPAASWTEGDPVNMEVAGQSTFSLLVWDAMTGDVLAEIDGYHAGIRAFVSPSTDRVAVFRAGTNPTDPPLMMCIYDVRDWSLVASFSDSVLGPDIEWISDTQLLATHPGDIRHVLFAGADVTVHRATPWWYQGEPIAASAEADLIAVPRGHTVVYLDRKRLEQPPPIVQDYLYDSADHLAVSPDGRHVLVAQGYHATDCFSLTSGAPVEGHGGNARDAHWLDDGNQYLVRRHGQFVVHSLDHADALGAVDFGHVTVSGTLVPDHLRALPDGQRIVVVATNENRPGTYVGVYNLADRAWDRITRAKIKDSSGCSATSTPDGSVIIVRSPRELVAFRADDVTELWRITREWSDEPFDDVALADAETVYARRSSSIDLYHAATGEPLGRWDHEQPRTSEYDHVHAHSFRLVAPPNGTWFVTPWYDGTVRLVDAPSGKAVVFRADDGGFIVNAAPIGDGSRLLTAQMDTTLIVWDVARLLEKAR